MFYFSRYASLFTSFNKSSPRLAIVKYIGCNWHLMRTHTHTYEFDGQIEWIGGEWKANGWVDTNKNVYANRRRT